LTADRFSASFVDVSKIGVIGAGLAGLTAALRLVEGGQQVELFERYPHPGGLARVLEIGGEPLEAAYHHIFTSDSDLISMAGELGLSETIEWLPSRMGIWADGRLWDFGTPASLLKFGPMSLVDKLRFAASTLLLQHWPNPTRFEQVTAAEWLRRHQGDGAWRSIWNPLLQQKFGEFAEHVAMVWIWSKMRVRGRSRSRTGLGECLGYMQGSFGRLVQALGRRIEKQGGNLNLGDAVERVEKLEGGFFLQARRQSLAVDRVVVAAPIPDYLSIAGHLLGEEERSRLGQMQAAAALCMVLELARPCTPYYWLNIADPELPFGGLIEHTNFIPAERYGKRHILYISKYMMPDDPFFRLTKQQLLETYLPGLQRINPELDASWILDSHLFRAEYAQPLVSVGYRSLIPDFRTPVPGLYLTSMGQVYPEDRGLSYAIAYGEKVARCLLEDLDR
jgi:protoporphyrinogen oxidase